MTITVGQLLLMTLISIGLGVAVGNYLVHHTNIIRWIRRHK